MPLRIGNPMPDLGGATEWLQGEADRATMEGKPVLVYFWALSCACCRRNVPTLRRWEAEYASQGLTFVAIHGPRQPEDRDVPRVTAALAEYEINGPAAIDNARVLADRFQIGDVWPHYFLFDADGKLRSRAAGDAPLNLMQGTLARIMDAPRHP